MPVAQIEKPIEVEPDHVYVIAPDQELTIRKGVVHTNKPRRRAATATRSIRSSARSPRTRASARSHRPLRHRHQRLARACASSRPKAASRSRRTPEIGRLSTACRAARSRPASSTWCCRRSKMPEALLNLARHPYVRQPAEGGRGGDARGSAERAADARARQTRRDFSSYRKRTLLRRIHRRMGLHRHREPAPTTSSACATTRTRSGRWRPT